MKMDRLEKLAVAWVMFYISATLATMGLVGYTLIHFVVKP